MKRRTHIATLLFLSIGWGSCNRVKNKMEQVTDKVKEKTQKVMNKVNPSFDHDTPDTENNRKRFVDFLKVNITPDVKNIYCFGDAIGINADYMFAFNCNEITSEKMIEEHQLTLDTLDSDNGFSMQHGFEWWEKDNIKRLQKFSWTDGKHLYKYYWYDKAHEKAYFFDFDI